MNKKSECIECKNKCNFYTTLDMYVCTNCKNLDKYHIITKTNTKLIYLLKDTDLTDLKQYFGKTRYGVATYYIKDDIENYAIVKYNTTRDNLYPTLENIKKEKDEIKREKQNKILIKKNKEKEIRKTKLLSELKKNKINFRNDSMLCKQYIEGSKDFSLDEVVQRMCEMKYLYEYCYMSRIKKQVYRKYLQELSQGIVNEYTVSTRAEKMALDKYSNGSFPKIYPWEKENIYDINKFIFFMLIYFIGIIGIPIMNRFIFFN